MRITVKHLEAKVGIVNTLLGHPADPPYSTVGAVVLYQAYGGKGVHRYSNDGGGVNDLMGGCQTAGECARFLDGMITALRITRETEVTEKADTADDERLIRKYDSN